MDGSQWVRRKDKRATLQSRRLRAAVFDLDHDRMKFDSAGLRIEQPRFVALVDRSPKVPAWLLRCGSAGTVWRLVAAAPVSTGLPGRYRYFATPAGVFDHSAWTQSE